MYRTSDAGHIIRVARRRAKEGAQNVSQSLGASRMMHVFVCFAPFFIHHLAWHSATIDARPSSVFNTFSSVIDGFDNAPWRLTERWGEGKRNERRKGEKATRKGFARTRAPFDLCSRVCGTTANINHGYGSTDGAGHRAGICESRDPNRQVG